ncbi:hypothetical protein BDN72DRAFT_856816 [Pluteus cervinus]|uniref:Uncharacterized protein n=1 Tax=Pluteus cervinus TaxID=181527 RepID=A0ACD3AXU4_9AGAR|nr:hypothetical protein BDN72DRAFT_856816 [Pluteus cervinus]
MKRCFKECLCVYVGRGRDEGGMKEKQVKSSKNKRNERNEGETKEGETCMNNRTEQEIEGTGYVHQIISTRKERKTESKKENKARKNRDWGHRIGSERGRRRWHAYGKREIIDQKGLGKGEERVGKKMGKFKGPPERLGQDETSKTKE